MDKRETGNYGEELVGRYLRRRWYRILERQYRCRFGEIDLIAENEQYISFTEVKLRRDASFAQAREFVDGRKQARLRTSAQLYLSQHPTGLQPRFDVVEIYAPQGLDTQNPVLNFLENAFT